MLSPGSGLVALLFGIVMAFGVFGSVALHELGHSVVALRYPLCSQTDSSLTNRRYYRTTQHAETASSRILDRDCWANCEFYFMDSV